MLSPRLEELVGADDLVDGGITRAPGQRPVGADMHEAFEIGVLLQGEQETLFEDMVASASSGDVMLSPGWEPHGWSRTSPDWLVVQVFFLPGFLGEEVFDGLSWLTLFAVPPRERPRVRTPEMREQVLGIGEELARELEERPQAWSAGVRLNVLRLLLTLRRGWEPRRRGSPHPEFTGTNLARIQPAMRLVQSGLRRHVSVSEAAAACALSVTQFRLIFRNTMGVSFGKFALRARLKRAAGLLVDGHASVEAIADETGFVDRSHLHRMFTRVFQTTPAQYRQQHRQ